MTKIEEIDVSRIVQSENSRSNYSKDELHELMSSMRANGLLQPIGVHPDIKGGDHYHVVYGNRRFLAAKKLGWKTVPCIVIEDITEQDFLVKNLTENVQRKNLSLPEEGRYYLMLRDEMNLSVDEIAARVGVNRRQVMESIDAFQIIPKEFRKDVRRSLPGKKVIGNIPSRAAMAIVNARVYNKEDMTTLLTKVKEGELNIKKVQQVGKLVRAGVKMKDALLRIEDTRTIGVFIPMKIHVISKLEKKYDKPFYKIVQEYLMENTEFEIDEWTERRDEQHKNLDKTQVHYEKIYVKKKKKPFKLENEQEGI